MTPSVFIAQDNPPGLGNLDNPVLPALETAGPRIAADIKKLLSSIGTGVSQFLAGDIDTLNAR